MTKDGGSNEGRAAGALTLALGLQRARSSPRIAALATDGGKRCLFRSIVDVNGQPVAEVAVLHGLDQGRVQDEPSLLGALSREEDVAPVAALFRERAVREFATAPGLSRDTLLYLPWYCALAAVDAVGPTVPEVLGRVQLPAARVVVELACPEVEDDLGVLAKRATWLRGMALSISLRVGSLSEIARSAVKALRPEWLHVASPPAFDKGARFAAFMEGIVEEGEAGPRCIIGGIDTPEHASFAEGLGADYLCGDSVAEARFLC